MGLGGHLLWTSVIRTLNDESGVPVRVCLVPMVSDLVAGRLYRGDATLADDEIFRHNPRVEFPPVVHKSSWSLRFDRLMAALIRRAGLTRAYERFALRRTLPGRMATQHYAHIDASMHSYVARELPDRMEWKQGGHIIDIILANFGVRARDHQCELYFTAEEEAEVDRVRRDYRITGDFVAIEPNSKTDWFGDLRAWPIDRWQAVVDRLRAADRLQIVQLGEAGGHELRQVLNLSGRIPVRIAICLMKRARLFLGLEGGLMHAANAIGVPSVIVWGGLTVPEFAAYPERHRVLCTYVECAPCGLRGNCPYGKKCLTSIDVAQVTDAIDDVLASRPLHLSRPGR